MSLFITLEGPDGSGKSTQARLLAGALRARGLVVLETREPGGTPLGEAVRDIMLAPDGPHATPLATAFLLSAARTQHVHDVIRPALQRGEVVISDRYADSTLAYQVAGGGVDSGDVRTLTEIAVGGLFPDITVHVDVPARLGLERAGRRGDLNRLDAESTGFHERVADAYRLLAAREPERWTSVDGTASPDEVHAAIMRAIEPYLSRVADAV